MTRRLCPVLSFLPLVLIALAPAPSAAREAEVSARAPGEGPSTFRLAISATAGYGGLVGVDDFPSHHGVLVTPSLELTWGRPRLRMGLRISAVLAPVLSRHGVDPAGEGYYSVAGGNIGFLVHHGNFWLSPGFGFSQFKMMEQLWDATSARGAADDEPETDYEEDGSLLVPEATVSLGYDIPVGRYLAVRLQADVGTVAFLMFRFQGSLGLQARF